MCIDGSSTSMRSVSKPTNTIPVWRRCRSNASDHKRNGKRNASRAGVPGRKSLPQADPLVGTAKVRQDASS